MKYVFGINMTENDDNHLIDGEIFCSKSLTTELKEEYKECENLSKNYAKHTSLPFGMNILKHLSFLGACFSFYFLMYDISGLTFKEVYQNPPAFFFLAVAFLVVWLILHIVKGIKRHAHKVEYERGESYIKNVTEHAKEFMQIPDDAVKMEILAFRYKIENNKMKVMTPSKFVCISHNNVPVYMHVLDFTLHITDLYQEWCIPLYAITGIKKIEETILFAAWKKEIPYDKGAFKKYKITMANGLGYFYMRPYYALCIARNDETYELFLPPYELDAICSLVGIHYHENGTFRRV